MPIKRDDARRALDLLEEYHGRLTQPKDAALRANIEKVIQIFRSRLFSALLDIQEYYELTLLDERRVDSQNVAEMVTSRVVDRKPTPVSYQNNHRYNNVGADEVEEPLPPPPPELMNNNFAAKSKAPQSIGSHHSSREADVDKRPEPPYDANWEYEDITLERGTTGLGFSIAGGTDNPHIGNDPSIFITKLIEGGTAMTDGRLRVNDVIVSVNDVSTENVTHAQSVEALKRAGNNVHLVVRRPKSAAETIMEIQLKKGSKGLGFSIGGGTDNQHIVGDNAIYITKIIDGGTAQEDGRLEMGDKLIAVNDVYLHDVTHDEAVAALKATKDTVRFIIGKPAYSPINGAYSDSMTRSPTQSQASATYSVTKTAAVAAAAHTNDKMPDVPKGRRKITLKKGSSGLGFNIVGGEDGEGIFVSFILAGGQAAQSGALFRGDQLLSVNGIDLRDATHEQAAAVLKGSGDVVEIIAEHLPNEYNRFEAKIHDLREQMMSSTTGSLLTIPPSANSSVKTTQKKTLYVKALFDLDAASDSSTPGRGLSFNYGDILHVTNANDEDWWQAQKVLPGDDIVGVIPSKQRIEKRERARLKNIKLMKNKKKKGKKKGEDATSDDEGLENIRTYATVVSRPLRITRPIIIFGPLKDRINDDLITDYPDRFASCIPHTTRPRRANEVDGRDYHFVSSREQMERDIENHLFIEAGQFSDNLYGTHVQSVRDIAEAGKHCILDVSGTAIQRLEDAELYPITLLIRPHSIALIRQWDEEVTEDEAQKAFEKMIKIEEEFGDQFSAIVSGDSLDDVYAVVKDIIKEQSGSVVWISAASPEH